MHKALGSRYSLSSLAQPLNALRLLGMLSAVASAAALLVPHPPAWLPGMAVNLTMLVAVQLFRVRGVEMPDALDKPDMTSLHLG